MLVSMETRLSWCQAPIPLFSFFKEVYRLQLSFFVGHEPKVSADRPGCSHEIGFPSLFGGSWIVSASVSCVRAWRVALCRICRYCYSGASVFLGEVKKTWGGHEILNFCETIPKLHLENS